jgi:hypothetical protein
MATQLVSRVHHFTQVEIPLPRFFEAPTVARLARYIEDAHYWSTQREEVASLEPLIDRDEGIL